ncbi:PepSY-associated TM helix domain-containing protein [Neotabrizicola sp. VNH66]|uniref:PepSY-associated TM helix domain-containing protein n=1 Tax=Neotabrizicola sp. VNH66 TaxID=3400918 RepID=UPI003C02FBD4
MTDATHGTAVPTAAAAASKFYFIAWRWHFYAGLYVIPFLAMLAVTGLVMLWISALAGVTGDKIPVVPGSAPLAVSALQTAAEAVVPGGTAATYLAPLSPDSAAVFAIASDAGKTGVSLNPYTGEVLHSFPWRAGWYDTVNKIHGTLMLGTTGDRLIEIAASLAMVLVVSGLYLHWPRGGQGSLLLPNLAARGRALWKSLHGVIGFWMSLVMVAFLISGLSWSGIWGERMVQAWNTFPAEKFGAPLSDQTHATMNHNGSKEVPWALEQTPLPESGSLTGITAIEGPVTLDAVAAFAERLALPGRFQIALPQRASGVWTISHDSMSNDGNDPAADRTIHIDQYTGNILADVRYEDYSPYAKAMAWGVAFHEGDMGWWNVALNTVFCLSILFLTISGLVMWWKRRPAGAPRLAAPPRPRDAGLWKGAALLMIVLGALFPLGGLAMVAVLLLDATLLRLLPGLKRVLS